MNIEVQGTPETLDQRHRASLRCGATTPDGGRYQLADVAVRRSLRLGELGTKPYPISSHNARHTPRVR